MFSNLKRENISKSLLRFYINKMSNLYYVYIEFIVNNCNLLYSLNLDGTETRNYENYSLSMFFFSIIINMQLKVGPIGLKFFVNTHDGMPRVKKFKIIFFSKFVFLQNYIFFHGQRRAHHLVIFLKLFFCLQYKIIKFSFSNGNH